MQELFYAIADCTLGKLLVAKSSKGICAVLLADNNAALLSELVAIFPQASLQESDALQSSCQAVCASYIEGHAPLKKALDIQGSAFQQQVWQAIGTIPRGEVITYQALATKLNKPRAVRAVASACAANRLALIVPCHRVVRSDGGLAGYRWGLKRKQQLLEYEQT